MRNKYQHPTKKPPTYSSVYDFVKAHQFTRFLNGGGTSQERMKAMRDVQNEEGMDCSKLIKRLQHGADNP
jgi:hypothetical protein